MMDRSRFEKEEDDWQREDGGRADELANSILCSVRKKKLSVYFRQIMKCVAGKRSCVAQYLRGLSAVSQVPPRLMSFKIPF